MSVLRHRWANHFSGGFRVSTSATEICGRKFDRSRVLRLWYSCTFKFCLINLTRRLQPFGMKESMSTLTDMEMNKWDSQLSEEREKVGYGTAVLFSAPAVLNPDGDLGTYLLVVWIWSWFEARLKVGGTARVSRSQWWLSPTHQPMTSAATRATSFQTRRAMYGG